MDKLKPFYLYRIRARNAIIGIWIPDGEGFLIRRNKFGDWHSFIEYHYDTGAPFGTFMPKKELEKTPFVADDFKLKTFNGDDHEYRMMTKEIEMMEYLQNRTEEILTNGK